MLACAGGLLLTGCEGGAGTGEQNGGASEFQTLLLVTAQNARASVAETEHMPFGGLLVEGDGASYTGAFNAVFEGNLGFFLRVLHGRSRRIPPFHVHVCFGGRPRGKLFRHLRIDGRRLDGRRKLPRTLGRVCEVRRRVPHDALLGVRRGGGMAEQ